MLVVVFGPPAAGKTTIANALADRLDDSDTHVLHSDAYRTNTYDRLLADAADALPDHDVVVCDGTFHDPAWRDRARDLDDAFLVLVTADLDTCLRRDWERENTGPSGPTDSGDGRHGSIGRTGVRTIHRELREQDVDADFTVDTDVLPLDTAIDLVERRVRDRLTP